MNLRPRQCQQRPDDSRQKMSEHISSKEIRRRILENTKHESNGPDSNTWSNLVSQVRYEVIRQIDIKLERAHITEEQLRLKCLGIVTELLDRQTDLAPFVSNRAERTLLVKQVLDELLACGPLEDLLADNNVTSIMVNSSSEIFFEKNGEIFRSTAAFSSEASLRTVLEFMVAPVGARVDELCPLAQVKLANGHHLYAVLPPLAAKGTSVVIQKSKGPHLSTEDLIKLDCLTPMVADLLRVCVEGRLNIFVVGVLGAGKTTLLNVLANSIPAMERIISVETDSELELKQANVVQLRVRKPSSEGRGEVTAQDLVKQAAFMRPDRVVLGECQSTEVRELLELMSTQSSCLTTLRGRNPEEALERLERLMSKADAGLSSNVGRQQISESVHLIVLLEVLSDGTKRVTRLSEIEGLENGTLRLHDFLQFREDGLNVDGKIIGEYKPTGYLPKLIQRLKYQGIDLPESLSLFQGGTL